jgi:hypothetical protein
LPQFGFLDLGFLLGKLGQPVAADAPELAKFGTRLLKSAFSGTDYLTRAFVTAIGLGANRPQDAVYPTSQKDSETEGRREPFTFHSAPRASRRRP